MYCKHCGFQLEEDANFCPKCGAKVAPVHHSEQADGRNSPKPQGPVEEKSAPRNSGGTRKRFVFLAAGVAVLLCAVLVYALTRGGGTEDPASPAETQETLQTGNDTSSDLETEKPLVEEPPDDSPEAQQAAAEAAYQDVLSQYQTTLAADSAAFMDAPETFFRGDYSTIYYYHMFHEQTFYYAYRDLDADGVDELLIGGGPRGNLEQISIIDLYGYNGSEAVQLLEEATLGDRSQLHLLQDGTLRFSGATDASGSEEHYYVVEGCVLQDAAPSLVAAANDITWRVLSADSDLAETLEPIDLINNPDLRYGINAFLTDFSESRFASSRPFDSISVNPDMAIEFALRYNDLNNWTAVQYDATTARIPADVIAQTVQQYFNAPVEHQSVANYYTYQDGYYSWPAASGEYTALCSVAEEALCSSDGTYTVSFTVFNAPYDVVSLEPFYSYTMDIARGDISLTADRNGTATICQREDGSFYLLSYELYQ